MKKFKTHFYFVAAMWLAIIILFACKKDEKKDTDFYIEAIVDGKSVVCREPFVGQLQNNNSSYSLIINMGNSETKEDLLIRLADLHHPNDWDLPLTWDKYHGSGLLASFTNETSYYAQLNVVQCLTSWDFNVTVQKWDDNVIEGTFFGNLYKGDCDELTPEGLESISLKEGRFRVEIEEI